MFRTSLRFAAIGLDHQGDLLLIENGNGKFSLPTMNLSGIDGLRMTNEVFLPEILGRNLKSLGLEIDSRKIQSMQGYYPAPRTGFFTWGTMIKGIEVSVGTKHVYVSPDDLQALVEKNKVTYGSPTHTLGLRGLASRDNPKPAYSMTAGNMLTVLQKGFQPQSVIVQE